MSELISEVDLQNYGLTLQSCVDRFGSGCSTPGAIEIPMLLVESLKAARKENESLKEQLREWKANQRCSILRERPDLPVDRIPAYEEIVRLQGLMPDLLKPRIRGIGDALALLPQTTLAYQYVRECLRNVRDRKGGECDLTFTTNQMTCNDYMSGCGKVCVAIWCGRDELDAALETIRQRNLS